MALLFASKGLAAAAHHVIDTSGKPVVYEEPPGGGATACSFRRAICVHGGAPAAALGVLGALERAWEAGIALGVPLPVSYDAYVTDGPSRSAIAARDGLSHFDQARTFSLLDGRLAGCARDFDAARELYAASTLAVSPAMDDGTLRAESTALAHLAAPCAPADAGVFQSQPDRALVDPRVAPGYVEDASIFFSFVDDSFAKEPGRAITASFALAPTKTPDDDHWIDEPDAFDVLRASLRDALGPGSTWEDVLASFAIARASFAPAPRFDWDVAWPRAARTLASPEGVAPTGAAYVRVDAAGRKPNERFTIDATWEELARFRWFVVKLDGSGKEISRVEATAAPKATHAHLQVVDLEGASALLVVGANVGAWDEPFDPDDVWEPHGWLLTISSETP